MFHRKSRKQKKNEEQNTIQNISLPVNLLTSNFSASQPISFNNELFSPSLGITATVSSYNDPSYSLSQPVIASPLNSPINPIYQYGSPSSRYINQLENTLNSPPQPSAHNLPSAIFGYSANTIDRSKMSGASRANLVERPNRSISVRNQDFVYNSSPSGYANALGTFQRGRSSNRDFDSYESNNSFLNFTKHVQFEREDVRSDRDSNSKRSDRDSASKRSDRDSTSKRSDRDSTSKKSDEKGSEKDEKRPSRDRPLASKSQKPPKPFERVQSRYNEIKSRAAAAAAAGDISILSEFSYSDRLNRKYNLDSGSNSFAVYDTISRSRSEKTPTSTRGKYEGTNIEILREILHDSKPDTSFSTIDINDGHRQSVTKNTTVNKKVVEESPLINFSKNPVMKSSSVNRDFGIKLDSKKNLEDYGTMTLGRHPKISHDHSDFISRSKSQLAESHRIDEPFSLSQPENFTRTSSRNHSSSSRARDDSPNRSFSRSRIDDIRSRMEDANRSFSRSRTDSPPGRSASRKRDDSPNRSFSRSRYEDANRSRYEDANRSFSRSRADSPPGRSKSRSRADSPPGRSKSRSRADSPPSRSKSRNRGDSPNRSFSRSHNDDINRSFSRSRMEEANRSFSRSRMEDANRSFSRSRTESPNRSFSRSRMDEANRSFSRSRMEDISRSGSRNRTDSPPGRSKSRSRADSPPGRSKSRSRADSPPGRSKSRSRADSPPRRSKSRTRADSPPGRSKSRHHTPTHSRNISKSTKPVNMNDFFNNLESEIDITINATFNTADELIANKKDDVVEVVEEDFTEPITEENKDSKDADDKKKRISNDVLGLVLGINSKDEKPRPDIIIEEEPDTEDEGDEKPPLAANILDDEIKNKILSELDGASSQEGSNEAENNENNLLKIVTNPLELAKSDNASAILSAIDDKPEKPISPLVVLGRSNSRNANHSRNLSTDSKVSTHSRNLSTDGIVAKHSRNLSTDGIVAKHSRKQSSDIARSASPLPLYSQSAPLSAQPTSPNSPTAALSENGDPELFDGISQDDIGNVSTLGRTGVLKSFLPSDIGDIIENEQDVDTLNISPEYRDNFIEYLTSQKYDVPTKDDFISVEGYYSWEEKTEKRPLVDVLAQLVDYRFSEEWVEEQENKKKVSKNNTNVVKAPEESTVEIPIIVKVIQAKELIAPKDGKTRNPYCEVKYNGSTFHTEKCDNTQEPYWNQHLEIKAKNIADSITITVWDKKEKEKKKIWKKDNNDEFLGQIKISITEFINESVRVGYISKWYNLEKRKDKKDKYAGGKILIEAGVGNATDIQEEKSLNEDAQDYDSDYEKLQAQLINCKVSFKHLFKILLKSCLDHDLIYINDKINSSSQNSEILSDEAKILLKVFSKQWVLGDAYLVISYLEQTFNMYVNNRIPIHVVVATFDVLNDSMNIDGWLPAYEQPHLIDLLEQMITYHSRQVCHYREYFPKGKPEGVLNHAIYLWRIIFKTKIYRDNHPEVPISFREEIRTQMVKHVENRYTKLLGLSSPFVENTEDILVGLAKLADLIVKDIEDDLNYYQDVFKKEINIVRLSSQIYLKSFIKELENNSERLGSEEALESSKATFELYRRVRLMDRQYATLVPNFKSISMGSGFNVEKWFNDFVIAWLKVQQERTLVWVKTAIATDTLEKMSDTQPYSTSVIDLFEIMFEELDLIKGLEWSDTEQYTEFLTTFARIVTKAIEQYCDAMEENEMKKDETNIDNQSCVKLSNIEKAIEKLNELFNKIKELNVIVEHVHDTNRAFTDDLTGTFNMEAIYAENLKPCNKNGLSNPYVVIKVPDDNTELIRTSIINDSINPRWDEAFQVSIAPTKTLEVCIYNKTSFLTFDEVIGKKTIHFNASWCDHQTHELIVKLEPQGRLLIRITMDGEGEDLSFFFKKSKQRLMRTSNDFIRELAYRVTPYVKEVYTKLMKSNESQNTVQIANAYIMSNAVPLTVSGRVANKEISQVEIDKDLKPITDYLNKNLETLCTHLTSKMAQKVIIEIWNEILGMLESSMIPPLYGAIERDRKILNVRQISIIVFSLDILFDFFHADGDELGIPKNKLLEYPVYEEIKLITRDYFLSVSELIESYEKTKKLYLLKLLRIQGYLGEHKTSRDKASKFVDKEIENINNSD